MFQLGMIPRRQRVPSAVLKKERGRVISRSPYFSVSTVQNGLDYPRFAIIAGSRTAKTAVERHHLKRRAAGVLRQKAQKAGDVILNILPPARELPARAFREELGKALLPVSAKS